MQNISLGNGAAAAAPEASSAANNPYSYNNIAGDIGGAAGIASGLMRGGASGYSSAALSAGSLAARNGLFGSSTGTANASLGTAGNILGLYNGLRSGGISGYGGAAVNAAQLGARAGAFGGASSAVGSAAGYAAIPLSLYNFGSNWQSGATGADAMNGASAGASIGTAIAPGIGTAVGAILGGAVGGLSSALGPGKMDPENTNWNNYAASYVNNGAASVAGATPAQNFQALTGIFDSRGTTIPFYNQFGRMGENQFMDAMTGKINSAISSGSLSKNATAQQAYNQVVQPWINSMSKGGWQNTNTVQGAPEKQAIGGLLTNLINQWQSGALTGSSQVGVSGQTIPGLSSYSGTYSGLGFTPSNVGYTAPVSAQQAKSFKLFPQ